MSLRSVIAAVESILAASGFSRAADNFTRQASPTGATRLAGSN